MVNSLVKRLVKVIYFLKLINVSPHGGYKVIIVFQATKKETEYAKKLHDSLVLSGLEEKDLPSILRRLQQLVLDKKSTSKTYFRKINEITKFYFQIRLRLLILA